MTATAVKRKPVATAPTPVPATVATERKVSEWKAAVGLVMLLVGAVGSAVAWHASKVRAEVMAEHRLETIERQVSDLQHDVTAIRRVVQTDQVRGVRTEQMLEILLDHAGRAPPPPMPAADDL